MDAMIFVAFLGGLALGWVLGQGWYAKRLSMKMSGIAVRNAMILKSFEARLQQRDPTSQVEAHDIDIKPGIEKPSDQWLS